MRLLLWLCVLLPAFAQYSPDWPSIDSRPLPAWYDEAKFGIFMHWGVYSVPGFHSAWFWWYWQGTEPVPEVVAFMKNNFKPDFTYADFGKQFTTELFHPKQFAELLKASGAKYFVPTSKHHEGYTIYPSNYSWMWNSVDVGPKRDLLGELRDAVNEIGGIQFGLYFSQYEWFNRLYLADKAANFSSQQYVNMVSQPQLQELVNNYKPEVIWSDGDWEAPPEYWNSTEFLAWLYNDSPVANKVVTNDRWGSGTSGQHGGFFSYGDRFDPGVLQDRKWESCTTLDKKAWVYRRNLRSEDVLTTLEIITLLTRTVSCGGNLLLNVGPTAYGTIAPIFEERLRSVGDWLRVNGEAIYHTKPWIYQNDTVNPDVWYTSTSSEACRQHYPLHNPQVSHSTTVFAIVLKWPHDNQLRLAAPRGTDKTKVHLLGNNHHLSVSSLPDGIKIDLSPIHWTELHSKDAWVIRLQNLADDHYDPTEYF